MMRQAPWLVALFLLACGSEARIDGGGGGPGAGGQGATGGAAGGAGAAGGGVAGEGGGGDGGGGGAVVSGIELVVDGAARPPEHLTLDVTASQYIGGINRWVFECVWRYDEPASDDEEETVGSTVRLMQLGPETEITAEDRTWAFPEDGGSALEITESTFTRAGAEPVDLAPAEGDLTLRREGDAFIGFVRLVLAGDPPVEARGPFSVPVPP
jgi:hypothetical protein